MNHITLAIAAAMIATTANAGDVCASFGGLAAAIMEKRQDGLPMSALMELADAGEIPDITRAIISDAYSHPRMMVQENRAAQIQDFRNEVESACYSSSMAD